MKTIERATLLILLASGASWTAAQTPAPAAEAKLDAAAELKSIRQRMQAMQSELGKKYEAAKTDDEREALFRDAPWAKFLDEYRALAEKAKGSEVGIQALLECLQLGPQAGQTSVPGDVLNELERDYLKHEALWRAMTPIGYSVWTIGAAKPEAFFRKVIAQSPHHAVQGAALYALGNLLLDEQNFGMPESGDAPPPQTPEGIAARKKEGRELLTRVLKDYPDTPASYENAPKDSIKKAIEGKFFELDHLQIGMTAPDFEATDVDGAKWKLADYRGKVVVIDFWGFW